MQPPLPPKDPETTPPLRFRGGWQSIGGDTALNTGQKSITDFWRRWHLSLSTWLREYLYIPLGGNTDLQRPPSTA